MCTCNNRFDHSRIHRRRVVTRIRPHRFHTECQCSQTDRYTCRNSQNHCTIHCGHKVVTHIHRCPVDTLHPCSQTDMRTCIKDEHQCSFHANTDSTRTHQCYFHKNLQSNHWYRHTDSHYLLACILRHSCRRYHGKQWARTHT